MERVAAARRRRVVALAAAVTITLAGCNTIPWPGGEGNATVEPADPPPPPQLVSSARAVAHAAVASWRNGDEVTMDRISTAGSARILGRPFPDPAPSFINCSPDILVAEAVACFFSAVDTMIVVVSLPGADDQWTVVSVRFRPTGREV